MYIPELRGKGVSIDSFPIRLVPMRSALRGRDEVGSNGGLERRRGKGGNFNKSEGNRLIKHQGSLYKQAVAISYGGPRR